MNILYAIDIDEEFHCIIYSSYTDFELLRLNSLYLLDEEI